MLLACKRSFPLTTSNARKSIVKCFPNKLLIAQIVVRKTGVKNSKTRRLEGSFVSEIKEVTLISHRNTYIFSPFSSPSPQIPTENMIVAEMASRRIGCKHLREMKWYSQPQSFSITLMESLFFFLTRAPNIATICQGHTGDGGDIRQEINLAYCSSQMCMGRNIHTLVYRCIISWKTCTTQQ